MLPGFGGHLVSEFFLERIGTVPPSANPQALPAERVRRELTAWRRRCGTLGPASSVRAMLEVGAGPLAEALGFDPPAAVTPIKNAMVATLRAGNGAAALLVTMWGEPLDPFWRVAVTEAGRRSVAWCLVFNGTTLRLVDAGRLYARRHVEFDLDLAIDEARTFAALWSLARADVIGDSHRLHAIVAESDRHAAGVCRSLRDGVLSASTDVLKALVVRSGRSRRRPLPRLDEGSSRR